MSTLKLSSNREQKTRDGHGIQSGDSVLIRLLRGDVRSVKVESDTTTSIPKFASFHANELIGQPYGLTYEIVDKKLKALPPRTHDEIEDTDATNELINDAGIVQPLTVHDIQAMKDAGATAEDIIKKQIEQHANYSLKTEYSKEKYKKRKEAKYSKIFTTIEPTLYNVCEYWFSKDQNRLRDLRVDSLSQMLNLANVRPGGRCLAVDDASGMLVSAVLDRMGGQGRVLTICPTDSPPAYPVMTQMNFDSAHTNILSSLNWATAEEDYTPILPPTDVPEEEVKSDRHKSRLGKRKAISNLLNTTREELFSGEFDSLLLASEYDPYSIIERLSPYLAGSASIVVHSPFAQILIDLQARLRNNPQFLCPSVTEAWLRRYQVLPGRTHPTMAMSGSGGFLLHVTKIYDAAEATHLLMRRRPKQSKTNPEAADTDINFDVISQ